MTGKFEEPELLDPRTLVARDQVACSNAGPRLQLLLAPGCEEVEWVSVCNTPAAPQEHDERPATPHGVALNLSGQGWTHGVFPQVWARRAIA